MSEPQTHRLLTKDIELPGGGVLRCGVYLTPEGHALDLVLSKGFERGPGWPVLPGEGVAVDVALVPRLIAALEELWGAVDPSGDDADRP